MSQACVFVCVCCLFFYTFAVLKPGKCNTEAHKMLEPLTIQLWGADLFKVGVEFRQVVVMVSVWVSLQEILFSLLYDGNREVYVFLCVSTEEEVENQVYQCPEERLSKHHSNSAIKQLNA